MENIRKIQNYLECGVIYQLFLRSFTPEGTLKAAEKLLPHLRSLGVSVVYLCPCFVADPDEDVSGWSDRQRASKLGNPQNPYRISDYYNVDPEYGTNDDLRDFIAAAHGLDLKVILDLVYFHCGPSAVFLTEHPDFVVRGADGKPAVGQWRFPRLNYESAELREYLWQNMELFIRDYDADGYRCDVGDAVPLDFWAEGVRRADAIKPGVMMLNEGSKGEYLETFDLNYTWAFRNAFRDCAEHGKPASVISDTVRNLHDSKLQGSYHSILFLENHDTVSDDYDNRLEKRVGKAAMDVGLAVNFTLPNVPFIYNGMELCDTNRHSLWANRFHAANLTIDWQNALNDDGCSRMKLLSSLAALRANEGAFGVSAQLEFAESGCDPVLAYTRTDGDRSFAVIANFSDKRVSASTSIEADTLDPVMLNGAAVSASGKLKAILEPYGFAIVKLS